MIFHLVITISAQFSVSGLKLHTVYLNKSNEFVKKKTEYIVSKTQESTTIINTTGRYCFITFKSGLLS